MINVKGKMKKKKRRKGREKSKKGREEKETWGVRGAKAPVKNCISMGF